MIEVGRKAAVWWSVPALGRVSEVSDGEIIDRYVLFHLARKTSP
jgi:hypothetical protein